MEFIKAFVVDLLGTAAILVGLMAFIGLVLQKNHQMKLFQVHLKRL